MSAETALAGTDSAARDHNRAAVEATVRDYFDGWFDGNAERMRRALHPDLAKRALDGEGQPEQVTSCTAEEMVTWTAAGNGVRRASSGRSYKIRIDEISSDIAAVTVHSVPYIEFLHLVRTGTGWRIVNALWRFADGYRPD